MPWQIALLASQQWHTALKIERRKAW